MDIWTRKNIETKFKVKKDMEKIYNVSNTIENGSRMDRVKSRIDSIQPAYTLLALLMVCLFGVNENAWGISQTKLTVNASGEGKVSVTKSNSAPSEYGSSSTQDYYHGWTVGETDTYYIWVQPNTGYRCTGVSNCSWNDNGYYTISFKGATLQKNATKTETATFVGNSYTISFAGNSKTDGTMSDQSGFVYGTAKTLSTNTFGRAYTVTYDANGGSCGTSSATATYTFNGWKSSDGTSYADKASVSTFSPTPAHDETVTLTAQWTSASVTLPNATKDGAVLDGWYSGDTKIGDPGEAYTPTANVTLKAKWINKYTFEITGSNYTINNDSWNQATAFNFVHADEANMKTTIEKKDVISYNRGTNTITALAIGTSKITFTQNTSSTVNNGTIEFTITVDSVANTLAVSNTEFTRYVEQDIANVRSGKNSDGTITTTSSNPNLAYYDIEDNTIYIPNTDAQTLPFSDVIITISQAATAKYKYKKHTITLTVQKYPNALKCGWNNGVAGDDWDENMGFDSKLPVKFSSSNTSGPAISVTQSPASAVATYKVGAGGANPDTIITNYREGSVTWTVSQDEDYKYVGDEVTCSVIVGTSSTECYVLDDSELVEWATVGRTKEYSVNGAAYQLKFQARRVAMAGFSSNSNFFAEYSTTTGDDNWNRLSPDLNLPNKETWYDFSFDVPENTKRVRMRTETGATGYRCIQNVKVTRLSKLILQNEGRSAISEIDMPVNTIGGNVTRNTFYIDYSTCASKIKLVSNNSRIKFAANNSTTYEFDVENGTRKAIELTYTSPADAEEIEATITVYTPYEHETLTVNAETKGLLSTTLEYIGTLSYGVDHANMNATELFQVRDENGDLVASPVITLSSNATGVINTVSENRAIDFLCGGSASITASYAGDGTYAAASNNGISVPITVNKLADAITWGNVQEDGKIHVWADSDVPSSIASANTTINSYVSGNNDRLIVSGSAGSFTLHAGQHGEVTLNATSAGDCTYNTTSDTKTIVVEPCFHNIVWTQNFMALTATREGVINEEFELDAYAVDSSNVATNVTINYSLKRGTIASLDGTTLTVSGVGIDTLIATTVADNKYAVATSMKIIRVRREGEPCNSYALNVSEEKRFSKIGDNDYVIDGLPNHLSCQVKKFSKITITGTNAYIKGWSKKQNDWVPLKQIYEQVDNTSWTDLTYDFTDEQSRDITKIKFTNSIEDGSKYVRNVLVTQRTYFTADVSSINRTASPIMVNEPFTQDIVVSYSDVPHIQYSLVGDVTEYLTLEPTETITNDCGGYGTYTFRLSGTFPKVKAYSTSHIYIYHSAGDTIDIPVNVTIACNGTFKFITTDGEWGTSEKWTCGGSTEHGLLPTLSSEVEIKKTVTVTGQGNAYMVDLSDANAKLIIMPGAGLTIGAGGIVGATAEKLILKAGTEGVTKGQTGYLRISPDYTGEMPSADVEFYSTVHYNTNLSGDGAATYQCVGAPVEGVLAKTVFTPGSYLYTWDEEQDGWVSSRTKLTFEAFKGFEVTQKKETAGLGFEYAGQLISVSDVKTIDLDYSDAVKGYNLLANSFTAPIDIAQFRAGDFINANQTIYILNAGTKANSDAQAGSIDAPGKWIGMPIATVAELAASGYPRMIAPLQGFWIKATGASPQLRLDYSRLVWGVDYSGDRANKPLRAPKRDAEMDEEMPITGKLQVSLYSETDRDFFFMLESERYDAAYENGYDAPKIPSGSMDVFTVEGENELGVDATNSIIGTRVGVRTGGESVYTFVFSHLSGENEWAIYDHETGDKTDINEGTEYMFFAEPYSLLNGRFEIVERADAPSVTTGVDGADNEVKAYKFIKDNQLYILKNGVLYNVMGRVVR